MVNSKRDMLAQSPQSVCPASLDGVLSSLCVPSTEPSESLAKLGLLEVLGKAKWETQAACRELTGLSPPSFHLPSFLLCLPNKITRAEPWNPQMEV